MKYTSILVILLFFQTINFAQSCLGMDIINTVNFDDGTSGTWSTFDVSGDDSWEFSTSFPNAFVNGFGGTGAEEDWLISPALDFSTITDIMMNFEYSESYSGPDMEVLYSTNYSGSGDPNSAIWITLGTLPDLTSSSSFPTNVDYTIDLSTFSFPTIYIAFKYTAIGPGGGDAEAWRIDEICISGGDPDTGGGDPISGNPLDYYGGIEDFIAGGGNCASLKTELSNLIDGQTVIPYTGSSYDVWDFMCEYDLHLADNGTDTIIWDVFSDEPNDNDPNDNETEYICSDMGGSASGEGGGFNRDHVFPKSWWGGSESVPQYSDVNNLLPSDIFVNSRKSNLQLGEVGTPTFTSKNGSRVGSPSNSCAPNVFEPIDEYKGDMARMFFYMATRYESQIAVWENNSSASDAALSGDSYTAFEPCLLNMLLQWHKDDPVSKKEVDRNEGVFIIQGNSNPYIDHPEYVDLVWGISNGTMITTACGSVTVTNCDYLGDATIRNNSLKKREYRVEEDAIFEFIVLDEDTLRGTAGQSITLEEGTFIENGGFAHFFIDDCTVDPTSFIGDTEGEINDKMENRTVSISRTEVPVRIYPNPFSGSFTVNFELEKASSISMSVFDFMGRRIAQPYQSAVLEAGSYQHQLFSEDWSSGMYQVVLETSKGLQSILILKQ